MVKVELVPDDAQVPVDEPKIHDEEDFSSDAESAFDDDDDFDANETLGERIVALKDAIPPSYRAKVSSAINTVSSAVQNTVSFGGKSLWVITSSTLLLGVPLSLCILSEQQLMEMEKGMQLGDPSNPVLAPTEQPVA